MSLIVAPTPFGLSAFAVAEGPQTCAGRQTLAEQSACAVVADPVGRV